MNVDQEADQLVLAELKKKLGECSKEGVVQGIEYYEKMLASLPEGDPARRMATRELGYYVEYRRIVYPELIPQPNQEGTTVNESKTDVISEEELDEKWDNRELGASEEHVGVANLTDAEKEAIAKAGLTHIVDAPTAPAVQVDDDDFLKDSVPACVLGEECESCT